jgi:hypothetical protein
VTRSRAAKLRLGAAAAAVLAVSALGLFGVTAGTGWTIVGWNNLGMHCMDSDFGVFSILPPYNTIHAQLVDASGHLVTDPAGVTVTYEAVADASGSVNATSGLGKTNFWDHVQALFGAPLGIDQGLAGKNMPGPGNTPQPMSWDGTFRWFIAEGIPITPKDDSGARNPYPMMKLVARDAGGAFLASTRIVLPVSDEMDCSACHASGSGPAARPSPDWVWDPDPQRDYRLNILLLHDQRQAANPLYAQALAAVQLPPQGLSYSVVVNGRPILCAACHASVALGAPGVAGVPALTASMHSFHGAVTDPTNGLTLDASTNRSACYRCHPGSTTRCLRGAMGTAVALDGTLAMQCQACHGSMSVVGDPLRTGWLQEPACQQCHTGTATSNNGQIRYTSAFDGGAPRVAVDDTFATNPETPGAGLSLFRFSKGHGGLQCEACHGSTHAEFPTTHLSDNLQSLDLQGHVGTLGECSACHSAAPAFGLLGPHGMHPIGQPWVNAHGDFTEINGYVICQPCHGTDYAGTVLSRDFSFRNLSTPWGTKSTWRGFQIGCYMCHIGPTHDTGNPNRAPVASAGSASTSAGAAVATALVASDPDKDPITLRIVNQPSNGTTALSGTTATYFPYAGSSGTDTFTFAAWDGQTNSNLATVTIAVGAAIPPTPTPTPIPPTATPTPPPPPPPTPTFTPTVPPTPTFTPVPTATPVPPPFIGSITALDKPFRIAVAGANFMPGVKVYIGSSTTPWSSTTYVSTMSLVLNGSKLKNLFPVGVPVTLKVVNPDGQLATKTFTR